MSTQNLILRDAASALGARRDNIPLGRHLVDMGVITNAQLVTGLYLQKRMAVPLGQILIAEGWVTAQDITAALSRQHGLYAVSLVQEPPDPTLLGAIDPDIWLRLGVIPWMRLGDAILIATARPDLFETVRAQLPARLTFLPVIADDHDIQQALSIRFANSLAQAAEHRVEARYSCRNWGQGGSRSTALAITLSTVLVLAFTLAAPLAMLTALSGIAVLSLLLITGMRLAGFLAQISAPIATLQDPEPNSDPPPRPRISMLVPLYREREIANALVRRLSQITYPKALLDIILVLEEGDDLTRRALDRSNLPPWVRIVEVPAHKGLTTKPRAMNYALDFCRGDIIGIWDAEDAPAPDQLDHVADRFAQVPEDVVCLQGILDYYNPRTNWRARCFTIEYAMWWRVILPGLARLGFVIPLGGTTLFMRRAALEKLGRWDAHNVTEDADLGVRLARFGYQTEMIATVTHEEANHRAWPWIKQRSRWLKGFMVTYLVHMRNPAALLRDLGPRRFLGVQVFFIGTISQFLLAPVLWSFWILSVGVSHPVAALFPSGQAVFWIIALFIFSELINITIGLMAVSGKDHRFLMGWVPTMMAYFPLGALAAYKALYELLSCPFYWDKTRHGVAPAEGAHAMQLLAPPD